jgi:hypothetical protein
VTLAERQGLDPAGRAAQLCRARHRSEPNEACRSARARDAERVADWEEVRRKNREWIFARPEIEFETLTRTEAVFTRHDVARELNRHLDYAGEFQMALAELDASPKLVNGAGAGRRPSRSGGHRQIGGAWRGTRGVGGGRLPGTRRGTRRQGGDGVAVQGRSMARFRLRFESE